MGQSSNVTINKLSANDERTLRQRAQEANLLLANPMLIEALETILAQARDELETCPVERMLEWQGKAAAARALPEQLRAVVLAAPPETEPTVNNDPGIT